MREEQRDQNFFPGFLFALVIVLFNLYFFAYGLFKAAGLVHPVINKFYAPLVSAGYFNSSFITKGVAALTLLLTFLVRSGISQDITWKQAATVTAVGGALFFFPAHVGTFITPSYIYTVLTIVGFIVFSRGVKMISGLLTSFRARKNDPYETFQQNEMLIADDQSFNLRMKYYWQGRWRMGWINVIEQRRHLFVSGGPGSGKSYSIIEEQLIQNIEHGFSMFCYDFKYPDLSQLVYNAFQKNKNVYREKYSLTDEQVEDVFCVINFADVRTSHRINPLDPMYIQTLSDATEVAKTILEDLKPNKDKGDPFFDGSAQTYIAALIWLLRNYDNGIYCSFPHLIELVSYDYKKTLELAKRDSHARTLLQSFIVADQKNAGGQIAGQVSSAQIPMTNMIDSHLYWVMRTNEVPLDINNLEHPKVLCVGNIPNKVKVTSTAIALIAARMFKQVNMRKGAPLNINIDECTTFHANGMAECMATCRSKDIGFTIAIQDPNQMFRDWGEKEAKAVMGNLMTQFYGQSIGEYDRHISELFGKEYRMHQSLTNGESDSVNTSYQLEERVSIRNLAELSQGQFAGFAADNDEHPNTLKQFNCFIQPDKAKRSMYKNFASSIPGRPSIEINFNAEEIRQECEADPEKSIRDHLCNKMKLEEKRKVVANKYYSPMDDYMVAAEALRQYKGMNDAERKNLLGEIVKTKQDADVEAVLNEHMFQVRAEVQSIFAHYNLTPPETFANHTPVATFTPESGGYSGSDNT